MVVFINVNLKEGIISPDQLQALIDAMPVDAGGQDGVVISGRLPVWAFSALVHHFHPRPFVGTFDPRLGGGVVVATHTSDVKVGDVVNIDTAKRFDVDF